jgi:hypothetical protein
MNIQQKEQQLLATIISCKKVMNVNNDVTMDVKLFESVTGGYGQISNEIIESNNVIKFSDFQKLGDNKFAYLKDVRSFVYGEENLNAMKPLNENFQFDPFKDELTKLISQLEKINDFNVLDLLDASILNTKIFAKKPINILGFNIMETLKVLETTPDLKGVFSIMFNKSNKFIYFIRKGEVLAYDIKTNKFNTLKNEQLTELNYRSVISSQISYNVVEIFNDLKITEPKLKEGFTDNLFSDSKRTKELQQYRENISFLKQ